MLRLSIASSGAATPSATSPAISHRTSAMPDRFSGRKIVAETSSLSPAHWRGRLASRPAPRLQTDVTVQGGGSRADSAGSGGGRDHQWHGNVHRVEQSLEIVDTSRRNTSGERMQLDGQFAFRAWPHYPADFRSDIHRDRRIVGSTRRDRPGSRGSPLAGKTQNTIVTGM